jgi:serine/threonine-protein phosphatase 2B catalytic subunit
MLRGNHECRQMTSFFNFKHECEIKYDGEVYDRIMDSFDALPLSCIINEKFIALHGGISPGIQTV